VAETDVPEKDDVAEVVLDRATHATKGMRDTAKWIASTLGAIPGVAVLSSLIRDPGEAGFDPGRLLLGIVLALLGALVGILMFGRVLAPIPLEDDDLTGFKMQKMPGNRWPEFPDLLNYIESARQVLSTETQSADAAASASQVAAGAAASAEATALASEAAAKQLPDDLIAKQRAARDRAAADVAKQVALAAAATAANATSDSNAAAAQLRARERYRTQAYLLEASDRVAERFKAAAVGGVVGALLVGVGVFLIAMAPNAKTDAAKPVSLITLVLNPEGQRALDCELDRLPALRVGGDDKTPQVITLPTEECDAREIPFVTESPTPLGDFETPAPVASP